MRILKPRRHIPSLLLLAAVFLAYGAALRDGFVWDDTALVLRDPLIRSPWLLGEGFRHFLFLDATPSAFYRPLQRAVYTLDYALAGFHPLVYHLTSLLAHAAAALALFAFARRLLERCGIRHAEKVALGAALVWAVHPIHSSAVIYVAGLADPLAALLGFGGLALLLANRRIAAGICLGGALFAKESGVFALLIGLALALWLDRKEPGQRRSWKPFVQVALPALLMASAYLGLRLSAQQTPPPAPEPVAMAVRPILALRAVAEYAGLLVLPAHLQMERDVTTQTGGEVRTTLAAARQREFQTVLGAVCVAAAVFWFRRRGKEAGAVRLCLLAALVAYLPVSNLFSLNATVAEHWVYIPSAFLFLAAGAALSGQRRLFPKAAPAVFLLCIAGLAARTAWRCADWHDEETFFRKTLQAGGDPSRMEINLAALELGRGNPGDLAAAVGHFRAALERRPEQPFAMLGLAGALVRQKNFPEARLWVERCLPVPLVRSQALVTLAVLEYQESGRDRVDLLREAAALDPHFWPVRKRYIAHLAERGETSDALRELQAALAREPFRAEEWEMLGRLLEKTGKSPLAARAFAEADWRDIHRNR